MNTPPRRVIDETGAVHTLSRRIGTGGQGEVWLVEGGRRIVKILKSGGDPEALRRQFTFVRRLDLRGLHVSRPIAVLKPPLVGYVAEFLDDMVPIKVLIDAPSHGLLQWHIDTGGLRRRLRLLAHAGEVLLGLHSKGVVYSDVSHNNVFVSEPVTASEVWLIDLDNLKYASEPGGNIIYTPGYGAPEIVAGTGSCTTLSDAWSFAVLCWRVLTLTHPFIGDLVDEGEPELEEQALAGRLPWVWHTEDPRNRCSTGLPWELVMAGQLFKLARRTFEEGLATPSRRPGVSEWVERLHKAADQTIRCPSCKGTYFVTEQNCPWCDEPRPEIIPIRLVRWDPTKGLVPSASRLARLPLTEEGLILPRRLTEGISGPQGREAHVFLNLAERGIEVRASSWKTAWVAPVDSPSTRRYPVDGRGRIVPRDGWMVFFEDPSKPQRVALLGRQA